MKCTYRGYRGYFPPSCKCDRCKAMWKKHQWLRKKCGPTYYSRGDTFNYYSGYYDAMQKMRKRA